VNLIVCSICNQDIPVAQFAAHVQVHAMEFDSERGIQEERIAVPKSWEYQMKEEAQVSPGRTIEISPSLMKSKQPKQPAVREKFEKPKILRRLKL